MIDFTINKEEHIKTIIENFNFEKVHKVMTMLNWEWFNNDGMGVPTIDQLKDTAISLLNDVFEFETRDYEYCSSGGFKATRYDDYLELSFYISEYESSILNGGPEYERRKILKTRKKKINIINKQ
jgi:hypothetical protein